MTANNLYIRSYCPYVETVSSICNPRTQLSSCSCLYTYERNKELKRVLETLIVIQLVKIFSAFYGTRRLITVFTTGRHKRTLCNISWGVASSPPNRQAGGSPIVFRPLLLIQYIRRRHGDRHTQKTTVSPMSSEIVCWDSFACHEGPYDASLRRTGQITTR